MASELRVNTLKDASGNNSIGMSYVAEGSQVVRVFDGTGTMPHDYVTVQYCFVDSRDDE